MISADQEATEPSTIASRKEEAVPTVLPYRFVRCNARFDHYETIAELKVIEVKNEMRI